MGGERARRRAAADPRCDDAGARAALQGAAGGERRAAEAAMRERKLRAHPQRTRPRRPRCRRPDGADAPRSPIAALHRRFRSRLRAIARTAAARRRVNGAPRPMHDVDRLSPLPPPAQVRAPVLVGVRRSPSSGWSSSPPATWSWRWLVIPIVHNFQQPDPDRRAMAAACGRRRVRVARPRLVRVRLRHGVTGHRVVFDLRRELIDKLLRLPTPLLRRHAAGVVQSKLTFDAHQLARRRRRRSRRRSASSLAIAASFGWLHVAQLAA